MALPGEDQRSGANLDGFGCWHTTENHVHDRRIGIERSRNPASRTISRSEDDYDKRAGTGKSPKRLLQQIIRGVIWNA